jgi:integrase/transposase-like protein
MSEEAPVEKPAFQTKVENGLRCPECASTRLYRDGLRYLADGSSVQRWLCRDCYHRFSWPKHERPLQKTLKQNLKGKHATTYNECSFRVKALLKQSVEGAMSEVEESEKRAAGATRLSEEQVKGKILEFALHLKRLGRTEGTIANYVHRLKHLLSLGADLTNPTSVLDAIMKKNSETNRLQLVKAYKNFAKYLGIQFEAPKIKYIRKLPFIPLEKELNDLIACCSRRTAGLLQLLKETGARLGEALELKWTDVDFEQRTIRITPEKGGEARMIKVSPQCIAMLNSLPKNDITIFGGKKRQWSFQKSLQIFRKKATAKFQNPRLLQIHFHTFRHWFATMLYAKTKDILYVKQQLGHVSIDNTMLYTRLVNFESDEYHVAHAKTLAEEDELIKAGFEFVRYDEKEGVAIYRKRK